MKTFKPFSVILILAFFLLGNSGHIMLSRVMTNTTIYPPNYNTERDLRILYLACGFYWEDKGDSKTCTVSRVANREYGYFPFPKVVIYGSGDKSDFCAVAWHLDTMKVFRVNSQGTIGWEEGNFGKKLIAINPLDKIWIYENLSSRNIIYYSCIVILPVATIIFTAWPGGYLVLNRKRKNPDSTYLGIVVGWLFIALLTGGFATDQNYSDLDFLAPLFGIPVIFSITRAFVLIKWGMEIKPGKDLSGYLENQNGGKFKKSGIYLLGVIGFLLVVYLTYSKMFLDYQNRYKKVPGKVESYIQANPSSFQKMCQQPFKIISRKFS